MNPVTVLLVDNVKEELADLKRYVEGEGLNVVAADLDNPAESALRLWSGRPDLSAAIVDLCMPASPGKSESADVGFRLLEDLRAARPGALLAACTGRGYPHDETRAARSGADLYIKKGDPYIGFLIAGFCKRALDRARTSACGGPGPVEEQHRDDYEWGLYDPELRKRHGGQTLIVCRRQVWGVGRNLREAWRDAQSRPGCPPRPQLTLVDVPLVHARPDNEYAWCLQDPEVQTRYRGLVAAFRGDEILGAGNSRAEAWQRAQQKPDCPAEEQITFVVIPTAALVSYS